MNVNPYESPTDVTSPFDENRLATILIAIAPAGFAIANWVNVIAFPGGQMDGEMAVRFLTLAIAWVLLAVLGCAYSIQLPRSDRRKSLAWITLWTTLGIALNLWCVRSIL